MQFSKYLISGMMLTMGSCAFAQNLRGTVESLLAADAAKAEASLKGPKKEDEPKPVVVASTKPVPLPKPEDELVLNGITGMKSQEQTSLFATVLVNGRSRRMQVGDKFDAWKLTKIDAGCVVLVADAKTSKRVCVDDPAPAQRNYSPVAAANAVSGAFGTPTLPSPVFKSRVVDSVSNIEIRQ